ncbi:MAG TPA: APC family permease [Humidesulfovibrio sp.]|uniref:APC family permease n=1 Tax=Humidesulfovibrio sp. TaxID=2910988 RepID=UPI002C16FAE3|nr:APC family permease [Humidesulfovibrio sp.]HWR04210.1 APC family permease [Humidesulfovibrio sp.]
MERNAKLGRKAKELIIGKSLSLKDTSIFHNLSLVAFFAWVGLGSDGLSSSCYGPAEAYLALGEHTFLALFVGLASVLTIFVISASYSQIIELFPSGGGGYVVASKLLSPSLGMVSGCALIVDYVLTITLSVASGADALFSFLPLAWEAYKLPVAVLGVVLLIVLNLRGVKESVTALVPIFLVFVLTHALAILYGLGTHLGNLPAIVERTAADAGAAHSQLGLFGMVLLILRAYSMGAGTYTGLEAVSNGLAILREPKVHTGKRTMTYMAVSLSVTVMGLILTYILFGVAEVKGKTLNAVLFETIAQGFGAPGQAFVLVTLLSEAAILFVAAQTGFLDGPRVLANMAMDRWFPTRFAMLSDRLVTQKGILLMGVAALILMLISHGSVELLIVLYSINVFITFVLSQLGMVRHWIEVRGRDPHWKKGLALNGLGLVLCSFILVTVTAIKFFEGGWATLLVTGAVAGLALTIRRHYDKTWGMLKKLDELLPVAEADTKPLFESSAVCSGEACDPGAKTAVLLVNGYNGLGMHTLMGIHKLFTGEFRNIIFVQVGMVDAGVFKGAEEMEALKTHIQADLDRYVDFARRRGIYAEGVSSVGVDVVEEVTKLAPEIRRRFPRAIFFGGQLVFPSDTFFTRLLHNHIVFAVQRQLYRQGVAFVIMPIRL